MHTIRDNFKTFNSPQDSVNYLVDRWYKDFGNYKGVNNASSPEAAAQMLRDAIAWQHFESWLDVHFQITGPFNDVHD